MNSIVSISAIALIFASSSAEAAAFKTIRIGDVDGFSFDPTGLNSASGFKVDTNGNGILESGEFLPNLSSTVARWKESKERIATYSKDDFDNRNNELENKYLTGRGFTDRGSSGSLLTDISLSTSYKDKMNELVAQGYQKTNKIPERRFVFDFTADTVQEDAPFFFNLVFGDYDVVPAEVLFTRADGSTFTKSLTKQNNSSGQDGLIQSAFVDLTFDDIFTHNSNNYDGFLSAALIAPNEPYLAIDFVELSTTAITEQDVPEPATALSLLTLGLLGARSLSKRR